MYCISNCLYKKCQSFWMDAPWDQLYATNYMVHLPARSRRREPPTTSTLLIELTVQTLASQEWPTWPWKCVCVCWANRAASYLFISAYTKKARVDPSNSSTVSAERFHASSEEFRVVWWLLVPNLHKTWNNEKEIRDLHLSRAQSIT
jgi:hypothetical protein